MPVRGSSCTLFAVLSMKYGITEIYNSREGTILLQIHFNKKWYLMTIYAYGYFATFCINVFNLHWCKWPHKMAIHQYLLVNNEILWHWDHHFIILSWFIGSSVHTWYMIMETKAWCLGIDACPCDKSTSRVYHYFKLINKSSW